MLEGLVALASSVSDEDGNPLGLAGRLVDSVTTPGASSDRDGLGAIASLAIAADVEATRT
jgi:hypothetical protein